MMNPTYKNGIVEKINNVSHSVKFEGDDKEYIATEIAARFVTTDLVGCKVSIRMEDETGFNFIRKMDGTAPTPKPKTTPKSAPVNQSQDEHIIELQGKKYITHAGLLNIAHSLGLMSISTEILEHDVERKMCVTKATVRMAYPEKYSDSLGYKEFSAIGDADPSNLNSMVKTAYIRMSETRAVNRALRFATNIGMTSSEELPDGDKQ